MGFGSTTGQFHGCTNLIITAADKPSLAGTTSLKNAFRNCLRIETVPGMASWNTANVTDMSFMFATAASFNQNISCWKVGQVTSYSDIFTDARAM